jgi:quercetin dioxygenase-like cupin family protein
MALTGSKIAAAMMALAGAMAMAGEPLRLTAAEIRAQEARGPGAGTSGVHGIQTTVLLGDPSQPGLYSIRLSIPPNTRIQAHSHRDERTAIVVEGTWFFGYGKVADTAATKALPAGSFYTEPAGIDHFALTRSKSVVVYITGFGPTSTTYVNAADDPRH